MSLPLFPEDGRRGNLEADLLSPHCFPQTTVRALVGRVSSEARRGISSKHPGRANPDALAHYRRLIAPLLRKPWPWIFTGRKHLPTHDSYVVVANHSGLGTVESLLLPDVWAQHLGPDRPIAA